MADDPADSMLAQYYGDGWADPSLGMSGRVDYGSGDRADYGTQHVLSGMGAEEAAKKREYNNALVHLFTNLFPAGAVARNALSSNALEAARRHMRLEQGKGNWQMGPVAFPANVSIYGGMAGGMSAVADHLLATNGYGAWGPWAAGGILAAAGAGARSLMGEHAYSTGRILRDMNRTDPKNQATLY